MTAASSHESPATTLRYRVGDIVRYVGSDARWVGQQGPVTRADYASHPDVPLVVDLPGGPKGIGVCFAESNVEMVTPAALTLFDFLLARIAEDEAVAREAVVPLAFEPFQVWRLSAGSPSDMPGAVLAEPARVLAECAAKRRIVERFGYLEEQKFLEAEDGQGWDTLLDLASIYASHADWREEWRP